MTRWRWADPGAVRAHIASRYLRGAPAETRLGEITLHEHQRQAAGRLRAAMARHGGALLADDVGLGKTYTAIAAACDAPALLVVAPAALLGMWRAALGRARRDADVASLEALSRSDPHPRRYDLVIIDEAHHARNPRTRRYARLAALTRNARVLLLSATPVHNATADLHALLALFLGSRAQRLSSEDLASCIVRRTRLELARADLPERGTARWLTVGGSPAVLQALTEIAPPCPTRDGGDAGALVTLSLVRAWASSDAALRTALTRRIARAESLADALTAGRYPTRADLRSWVVGDDATQLAFPELVIDTAPPADRATADLLRAIRRHTAGARHALHVLDSAPSLDTHRAALIRDVRHRHPGERIVAFSQFAESVRAIYSRLAADGRVAAVTADGATVPGGRMSRADALARFAPLATGAHVPSRADAIELLLTTDLLSEGLNLQDASVVVHLDLPWTAARLTQRMGRVWRIGSRHERVHEYAFAPPASANELLRLTDLLRTKAGAAWAAIGDPFSPLLLSLAPDARDPAGDRPGTVEALRRVLDDWRGHCHATGARDRAAWNPLVPGHAEVPVGAVRSTCDAWLAVVAGETRAVIVAGGQGAAPTTDPSRVLETVLAAGGRPCAASPARVERVLREVDRWLASQRAASEAGLADVGSAVRARVAGRIAAVAAAAPPHRRPAVLRLAAAARAVVSQARSAGDERLLGALVAPGTAPCEGRAAEEWLDRVIEVGGGERACSATTNDASPELCALLLLLAER